MPGEIDASPAGVDAIRQTPNNREMFQWQERFSSREPRATLPVY